MLRPRTRKYVLPKQNDETALQYSDSTVVDDAGGVRPTDRQRQNKTGSKSGKKQMPLRKFRLNQQTAFFTFYSLFSSFTPTA